MRPHRAILLAAAPLLGGCFTYVPTPLAEVPPAATVRVHLSDDQLVRVLDLAERADQTVTGEFLGANGDSVTLVVRGGGSYRQVILPASGVLDTQVRHLEGGKSAAISAAAVGLVGFLAWKGFSGRGGPGRGDPDGPGPDEALIPGIRISFPGAVLSRLFGR